MAEYPDLSWCLYDDFWRALVLFDEADDLDSFAQVVDLWNKRESWKVGSKDDGSKVLIVGVKIEETHYT